MKPSWLRAAFAVALASGAWWDPLRCADSIELLNGQTIANVQILVAKSDLVTYKLPNTPTAQTKPGDQILSITRESTLLQGPRGALDSGSIGKALPDLERIVAAPGKDDEWQKAEARYLIGRAHRIAGDSKAAIDAYNSYIEKLTGANDWFLPHATYELAETQLLAKQPGTAEITFKKLMAYGGQWTFRAKLGEAMSVLASKGGAEAMKVRSLCDEVIKSRDAPQQLKNQAIVIRAKILILQKNPKQVIDELTSGFFSASKGEIDYSAERAEATLLMGKAYLLLEGKENQDSAEIWFLRVPALYGRYSTLHAEACDLLAAFYEKAGNAPRASEWRTRKQGARPAAASIPAPSAPAATPPEPTPTPAAQPAPKKATPPGPKNEGPKGSK